jgi:hypothetical protein
MGDSGKRREAELADGIGQYVGAIGKLRLPLPTIFNALTPV